MNFATMCNIPALPRVIKLVMETFKRSQRADTDREKTFLGRGIERKSCRSTKHFYRGER